MRPEVLGELPPEWPADGGLGWARGKSDVALQSEVWIEDPAKERPTTGAAVAHSSRGVREGAEWAHKGGVWWYQPRRRPHCQESHRSSRSARGKEPDPEDQLTKAGPGNALALPKGCSKRTPAEEPADYQPSKELGPAFAAEGNPYDLRSQAQRRESRPYAQTPELTEALNMPT